MFFMFVFSQKNSFWKKQAMSKNVKIKKGKKDIANPQTYTLNFDGLKRALQYTPLREDYNKTLVLLYLFQALMVIILIIG